MFKKNQEKPWYLKPGTPNKYTKKVSLNDHRTLPNGSVVVKQYPWPKDHDGYHFNNLKVGKVGINRAR